jgi:DNA topoisomerase VI subunit A
MQEPKSQHGAEPDIDVFVRCDCDPYGIDKLFLNLKIGRETFFREQYYAVDTGQQ